MALLQDLVDAVIEDMDEIIKGYHSEFGGLDSTEAGLRLEIRRDLEHALGEVLKQHGISSTS